MDHSPLHPVVPALPRLACEALADTGAVHLCLPEHVVVQRQLQELEKRGVTLADGSKRLVAYVGPVRVGFANRQCYVGAMALGNDVLLGAIPMEDLDLVLHPLTREITVNPASPNVASSVAMAVRAQIPI